MVLDLKKTSLQTLSKKLVVAGFQLPCTAGATAGCPGSTAASSARRAPLPAARLAPLAAFSSVASAAGFTARGKMMKNETTLEDQQYYKEYKKISMKKLNILKKCNAARRARRQVNNCQIKIYIAKSSGF